MPPWPSSQRDAPLGTDLEAVIEADPQLDFTARPTDVRYWAERFPEFDPLVHEICALNQQGVKPKEFRGMLKKLVKKKNDRDDAAAGAPEFSLPG